MDACGTADCQKHAGVENGSDRRARVAAERRCGECALFVLIEQQIEPGCLSRLGARQIARRFAPLDAVGSRSRCFTRPTVHMHQCIGPEPGRLQLFGRRSLHPKPAAQVAALIIKNSRFISARTLGLMGFKPDDAIWRLVNSSD